MKLVKKLAAKRKPKSQDSASSSNNRITNDTLAEHREAAIQRGKRYKYPMQLAKHRVVVISLALVILLAAGSSLYTWYQLYKAQNTTGFFYRVTQIIPLNIAEVNGQNVAYKDYLMELRSAMHYLNSKEAVNFSSDDGARMLEYQKRSALNKVIEQARVRQLAAEKNVSLSDAEVDAFINNQVKSNRLGATLEDYRQVIRDYYDWSFDEYRQSVKNQLLRRKVVIAVDTTAKDKADSILASVKGGKDFAAVAKESSEDMATKATGGDLGFIDAKSGDPDGILKTTRNMKIGDVSPVITGVRSLYIVKLLEKRGDDVHVARISVTLKQFDEDIKSLKSGDKVKEYIQVDKSTGGSGTATRQ